MNASEKIARLRELRSKATAGPWVSPITSEGDVWDMNDDKFLPGIPLMRAERGNYKSWGRSLSNDEREANAAAIVAAMNSLEPLLACASVLELLVGSIDAARFEGLHDAIANEDAERMKDLLTRRILHHEHDARSALQALAEGGGE